MAFPFLIIYVTILFLRPQEWWEPVSGYELVNVFAILTIFTTFISQSRMTNPSQGLMRNKLARLIFGLLAAVALSQLVQFRIQGAFDAFTEFGKMVVLFSLTLMLVNNPQRVRKMMWVVVLSAALLSVSAFLQISQGYGFGHVTPIGSVDTGDFRVQGTGIFADPNDFAMLYLMGLPFVFTLLQSKGNILTKGFLLCLLPGFFYTLYYTGSRGAVVGFSFSLLAFLWVGRRGSIVRVLFTIIILAIAVAFGPARARESVYESSAAGRVSEWGAGNAYLKQNPLFGIGYSRWGDFETVAPHNSFVQCYAELGLVGYFFWFSLSWLVIRALQRVVKLKNQLEPEVVKLARGLFACLVGFFTSAFFLTHAYHPPLYFLLGMGIGLVLFAQTQPNVPPKALTITATDLRWCALWELLSVPAIWLIAKAYWATAGG